MTAVLAPADDSAKSLYSLSATICVGDVTCDRNVCPLGDASIQEIVAAMKEDCEFRNPLVELGTLTVMQGGKCIAPARYSTESLDGPFDDGELNEVTAHFDDDSSEEIAI